MPAFNLEVPAVCTPGHLIGLSVLILKIPAVRSPVVSGFLSVRTAIVHRVIFTVSSIAHPKASRPAIGFFQTHVRVIMPPAVLPYIWCCKF